MSFFGFDATIPKERSPAGGSRGIFEVPDPFAEVAQATARRAHGDDDDDAFVFHCPILRYYFFLCQSPVIRETTN